MNNWFGSTVIHSSVVRRPIDLDLRQCDRAEADAEQFGHYSRTNGSCVLREHTILTHRWPMIQRWVHGII
jgi:hypothetical protein